MTTDISKLEEKTNLVAVRGIALSTTMRFTSMVEIMEFSKLMATTKVPGSVPAHCVGNPSMCLAICIQAHEWEMTPFQVARKSYVVNGVLSFEAQLIAAVAIRRAPIKNRFRYEFTGDGLDMQCKVTATFEGDTSPQEYVSPRVRDIKNKNSPLWTSDQQQQLGYFSVRSWVRRHCPDVLLGIYTPDEIDPSISMRSVGQQDFQRVENPLADVIEQPVSRYWYHPESGSLWESEIDEKAKDPTVEELGVVHYNQLLVMAERERSSQEEAEAADAMAHRASVAERQQKEQTRYRDEATEAHAAKVKRERAAREASQDRREPASEPKPAEATKVAPKAENAPRASVEAPAGNGFYQDALVTISNAVDAGKLNRWWRETRKARTEAGLAGSELDTLTQTYNNKFITLSAGA